jgi:hypothetical protein
LTQSFTQLAQASSDIEAAPSLLQVITQHNPLSFGHAFVCMARS